jgi:FdhD protein
MPWSEEPALALARAQPLAMHALRLLADAEREAREPGQGVALTRLAKALNVPLSVLMREFSHLGHARIGAVAGPGWVRVEADAGGRWLAWTTDAGRQAAEADRSVVAVQAWSFTDEATSLRSEPSEPVGTSEPSDPSRPTGPTGPTPSSGPGHREWVAEESPVALAYNGISHAVMLATPADLEDFALGFSLTEGLIDAPADLLDIEPEETAEGTVLHLRIAARCEMRLQARRRNLAGRTGCGLCGTDSLGQVRRRGLAPVQPLPAQPASLARAMQALAEAQRLQAITGGVHAAGWCSLDGELRLIREDVGRHNALDKLIGAICRQQHDARDGFVVVSSRASFEMVQKTAAAGVGLLAAVSAPTGLAVRLAAELGVTLVGFVREQRATVYRPEQAGAGDG